MPRSLFSVEYVSGDRSKVLSLASGLYMIGREQRCSSGEDVPEVCWVEAGGSAVTGIVSRRM